MTPNDIEVLIHYHVSSSIHPRIEAPAVKGAITLLIKHELIVRSEGKIDIYETTAKGAAHIAQLCQLPFPKKAWVNFKGEISKVKL